MKRIIPAILLGALAALSLPALGQQPETGPAASGSKDAHPIRNTETGVRGPSGASPDTGPHGPRDVTKDAEPGKKKTADELKRSGQSQPDTSKN